MHARTLFVVAMVGLVALAAAAKPQSIHIATVVDASNAMYVSPSGCDANPGTEDRPKKTLSGAVAALSSTQDTILLFAGSYTESSPVVIESKKAITLANAGGASSGANLTFSSGGLVTTGVDQVVVDGLLFTGANQGTGLVVMGETNVKLTNCKFFTFAIAVEVTSATGNSLFAFNEASKVNTFFRVISNHATFDQNSLFDQNLGGGTALILSGSQNLYSGFLLDKIDTGIVVTEAGSGFKANLFAGSSMYGVRNVGIIIDSLSGPSDFIGNSIYMDPATSAPAMQINENVDGLYVGNSTFVGAHSITKSLIEVEAQASVSFFALKFQRAVNGVHMTGPLINSKMTYSCTEEISGEIAVCDCGAANTCISLADNAECATNN